jgi:hypothetical protein
MLRPPSLAAEQGQSNREFIFQVFQPDALVFVDE